MQDARVARTERFFIGQEAYHGETTVKGNTDFGGFSGARYVHNTPLERVGCAR